MNALLIAVLTGLGGMLGWGFADFFAKKTIDKIGDVTTLFWGQLIGIVPILVLFLFHPTLPSLGTNGYIYLAFLGIWSGLSYIPTYVAFGKGKVSLLSPIFASYAVVVSILSAVVFGELIPGSRVVAFVVVFVGILLVNGDPRMIWATLTGKERSPDAVKGLPEIFLAIVLYSLWLIALDQFVSGNYWVPFLLVIRIFSSISLFIYAKLRNIKLTFNDRTIWKFLIAIGFFDVAAFAFVSWGYSVSPFVSVVTMLSAAFSLPTIILARVFLKERATILQTVGSVVIIVGVVLVSIL
jgi:drug/metabolite transporter (DMT)-like permease